MSLIERALPKALLTDLYQLTMAYGYWKAGKADEHAVFHLLFRKQPFKGGFTICAGLADAIEYLKGFAFEREDLEYLAELKESSFLRRSF
jgi:nicotinate phosphoribosyltransferase